MKQIITHFTDTDLYTFSVCLAVLENYPRAHVSYEFFDRNSEAFPEGFADELNKQIQGMAQIVPSKEELDFLKSKCYYFKEWFFEFLSAYRFDPNEVNCWQDDELKLHIKISGLWYRTIFWEVPLLATISEMVHNHRRKNGMEPEYDGRREYTKSMKRGKKLIENGVVFSEFGTRRRYSLENHENILWGLMEANKQYGTEKNGKCVGTSNVYLAYKFKKEFDIDMNVTGTMSHQFPCSIAAMFGPIEANYMAMDAWAKTYGTDLGTYLYDGLGWKAFESNFSKRFAKDYDGLRVDSGDNYEMVEKIIAKYRELGVDPSSKSIIFSNALDVDEAIKLHNYCKDRIKPSMGIGTKLSCNVEGAKPLNIVIKATEARLTEKRENNYVVKLSDDIGKHTGDSETIQIYKKLLHIC